MLSETYTTCTNSEAALCLVRKELWELCISCCKRSCVDSQLCVQAGQGSSTGKKGSAGKQSAGSRDAGTPSSKTPPAKTPQPTPGVAGTPQPESATPNTEKDMGVRSACRDLQARAAASEEPTATTPAAPVRSIPVAAAAVTPSTPIAIAGRSSGAGGRRSSGSDVAGTSSEGAWGSANSGGGWSSYR